MPLTTQDFPGRLACVVFIRGCPWRCSYCHNPHLQSRGADADVMTWAEVLSFLSRRNGLLDGVVFSGGEPLIDPALGGAVKDIKRLGFQVGLHTAGCFPDRLEPLLDDIDWIGLDIKTDHPYYDDLTKAPQSADAVFKTLDLILARKNVELECRTTIAPSWLPEERLLAMARRLHASGVQRFVLQPFRPFSSDMSGVGTGTHAYPSESIQRQLSALFPEFFIR